MFGRKTFEEKITTAIRAEFEEIIAGLEEDRRRYLSRLELKQKTRAALEDAETQARGLHSERVALKKRFWRAYYEEDEVLLSKIESRGRSLERAAKKAEKTLKKARASFEKADFDEVGEGFALKAKVDIAQEEVERRVGALEKALKGVLAGVRHDIEEMGRTLREQYEEPSFDSAEEREAHVGKMIEILNAVTESYAPGKK